MPKDLQEDVLGAISVQALAQVTYCYPFQPHDQFDKPNYYF